LYSRVKNKHYFQKYCMENIITILQDIFPFLLKGMRPYVHSNKSKSSSQNWKQDGRNIKFERTEWRYPFLKEEETETKYYFYLIKLSLN